MILHTFKAGCQNLYLLLYDISGYQLSPKTVLKVWVFFKTTSNYFSVFSWILLRQRENQSLIYNSEDRDLIYNSEVRWRFWDSSLSSLATEWKVLFYFLETNIILQSCLAQLGKPNVAWNKFYYEVMILSWNA